MAREPQMQLFALSDGLRCPPAVMIRTPAGPRRAREQRRSACESRFWAAASPGLPLH